MSDKSGNAIVITQLSIILVFLTTLSIFDYRQKTPVVTKKDFSREQLNCMNMFNAHNFEDSAQCYKQLQNLDNSPAIEYNIAVSLGYAKNYDESVEILENLKSRNDLDDNLRKKINFAYEEFMDSKIKADNFKKHDKGNYLSDLTRTARWQNPNNIKVYACNDYGKEDAIKEAFNKWDNALYSTVDFVFIDSPYDADITVKAVDISYFGNDKAGETKIRYVNDSDKENAKRKTIDRADIKISYNNPMKSPWSDSEFSGIILHEIGHALGIVDHSKHKGDIMYFDTSTYQKGTISNRDVNTVKIIYGNLAN